MNGPGIAALFVFSVFNCFAAGAPFERLTHAFHNPSYKGNLICFHEKDEKGNSGLSWRLKLNYGEQSQYFVIFYKNRLSLLRKELLNPVSLYVAGGAAKDPRKGPHSKSREFDYRSPIRYVVFHNFKKQHDKAPSDREIEQLFPNSIQHFENLETVMTHYKESEEPVFVIDLKMILDFCNEKWREQLPIRQIPRIVPLLERLIFPLLPYHDMTLADLKNLETSREDEKLDSDSCSVS